MIASAPRAEVVSAARPCQRFHIEPRALRDRRDRGADRRLRGARPIADGRARRHRGDRRARYLLEQFFGPERTIATTATGTRPRSRPCSRQCGRPRRARARDPPQRRLRRRAGDRAAPRGTVDYVHLAIGHSATFVGSVGIAPPPPTPRTRSRADRALRSACRCSATTRIVEPARGRRADRRAASLDAVRDEPRPDHRPRPAAQGPRRRLDAVLRCIGCNACIAHYHAETPIAARRTRGRGGSLRCRRRGRAAGPSGGRSPRPPSAAGQGATRRSACPVPATGGAWSSGAGPAGLAAAAEAGAAGDEVIVLERAERIGGQTRLAGAAPGHEELARTLAANYEMLLDRGGVELRLGTEADATTVATLSPDLVVLATGARPYAAAPDLGEVAVLQAWDVLAGARPRGRVLVADWGGEPTGLDTAELLAGAGREVTLLTAAPMPGFSVHQYARHQYLARLERAGVRFAWAWSSTRPPGRRSAAAASSPRSARPRLPPTPWSSRSAASPRTGSGRRCGPPASPT